jgi:hypothetical protein
MRSRVISWSMMLCALSAAACSKGTEGPVATSIVVTPAGQLTFASINRTRKLKAQVLDQHGDSMPGLKVAWSSAGISVASVDTAGLVTAKGNGSTTIRATSGSVHLDVSCAVAQAAAALSSFAGDAQSGSAGSALVSPLDVRATDSLGTPVAGLSVGFVVTQGGGSLSAASATTNASGDATTTWTLGTMAGPQLVSASSGTLAAVNFTANATSGAAKNIAINAGNNQTYVVGGTLPVAPSAKVTDRFGNVVSGAQVVFSVGVGGGSVTGATQSSNGSGIATVGSWTLGAAGTNTLIATLSVTATTAPFSATAVTPGVPKNVTLVAGNSQTGLVGYALNVRPAVRVTDTTGLPVGSAAVTFVVTGGGGSVVNANVNTTGNGIAQVGNWIVGAAPGTNTLSATVTGSVTGSPVIFAATGASPTFNITLQNIGPALSAPVQQAFDSAVAKWQRIIYQDVTDIPGFQVAANTCGPSPAISTDVDDVLILMKFDSIDGPGKILGQAGPCYIRTSGFLPIMGIMQFDTADVDSLIASGSLNAVILHEMGHVLGFGTLWGSSYYNCVQNPSVTGALVDTYFSCPDGRAAFDSIGGTNYTGGNKVPVENCVGRSSCGAGTYNSHWRESTFSNELMTGFLNTSTVNPLSVMTIAAMGDLSYTVNFAAADPYSRAFSSSPAMMAMPGAQIDLGDHVYHGPIGVVDRNGRIVRWIH